MQTLSKTTIAVLTSMLPIAAHADSSVFTGKNAFASAYGSGLVPDSFVSVNVFQNASKNGQAKNSVSGADVYENIYAGGGCIFGYGSSVEGVQVTASGKAVNSEGSVTIDLYDCNTGNVVGSDTVSFSINATPIKGQLNSSLSTQHSEYGTTRVNSHFDSSYYQASSDEVAMTSSNLGQISIFYAEVGVSKSHSVEISK